MDYAKEIAREKEKARQLKTENQLLLIENDRLRSLLKTMEDYDKRIEKIKAQYK